MDAIERAIEYLCDDRISSLYKGYHPLLQMAAELEGGAPCDRRLLARAAEGCGASMPRLYGCLNSIRKKILSLAPAAERERIGAMDLYGFVQYVAGGGGQRPG